MGGRSCFITSGAFGHGLLCTLQVICITCASPLNPTQKNCSPLQSTVVEKSKKNCQKFAIFNKNAFLIFFKAVFS